MSDDIGVHFYDSAPLGFPPDRLGGPGPQLKPSGDSAQRLQNRVRRAAAVTRSQPARKGERAFIAQPPPTSGAPRHAPSVSLGQRLVLRPALCGTQQRARFSFCCSAFRLAHGRGPPVGAVVRVVPWRIRRIRHDLLWRGAFGSMGASRPRPRPGCPAVHECSSAVRGQSLNGASKPCPLSPVSPLRGFRPLRTKRLRTGWKAA